MYLEVDRVRPGEPAELVAVIRHDGRRAKVDGDHEGVSKIVEHYRRRSEVEDQPHPDDDFEGWTDWMHGRSNGYTSFRKVRERGDG